MGCQRAGHPSYQAPDALATKLTSYVDKLADFSGARMGSIDISAGDISSRVLKLVVPEGGVNAAQQAVINRVATQAATQGVKVVMVPFR